MWPGVSGAPFEASATDGEQSRSSRCTNVLVKGAGRCSVTTVGGQFLGNCVRMESTASTPPVEAPIATMRPLSGAPLGACEVAGALGAETRAPKRACAAIFTFSGRLAKVLGCSIVGLAMQSTAPISIALTAAEVPRSVSEETIMTGSGRSRITFSRKSSPFIFGISTSSVMTSGLSALMASRASSGSAAWPTT